jgi:pimeloyl-ACP methyl ester carboxylesterase
MKLVLLPGMDGTGLLFKPLLDCLSNKIDYRIISLPQGAQDYATLIEKLAVDLEGEEDLILLAESFSGPIALEFTRRFSGRVKGLIFVASFLNCPNNWLKWLGGILPLKMLIGLPMPNFMLRRYLLGSDATAELVELFKEAQGKVDKTLLVERLDAVRQLRIQDDPQPLRLPCFYLEALDDRLLNDRCLEAFYEVFGRVSQRRISGPHLLLQSRPKECARIVESIIFGLCDGD